jgi:hypothetical protein
MNKGYAERYRLLESLEQARNNLARNTQRIIRQRELVSALKREGFDALHARKLLSEFEEMQATYVADCGKLESRLAQALNGHNRT